MGSSCSSGQGHKEKDSGSTRSEESPSYQVSQRVESGLNSGVVLEVSSEAKKQSFQQQQASTNSQAARPLHQAVLPSLSDTASPSSPAPVEKSGLLERETALPLPGTCKAPKITLYISAADSQDCKVEKSILHNDVYPELREHCRECGFELHIVDLHWSIQEKTPEPSELCLHELQRQSERGYLVPIVLLNSRLGAAQLPKTIESADFEMAAGNSGTILRKWYHRDTHAQPPCYRLLPAAHHIPGFKSDVKAEKEKAVEEWRSEVEKILSVMLAAFSQELRDTYMTTVLEQEVHNTVLMSQELAKRCLWLCRVFTHLTEDNSQASLAESELKRRLDILQKGLKNELTESHIVRLTVKWTNGEIDPNNVDHAQYLAELAMVARTHLKTIADSIMDEHHSKNSPKEAHGLPTWLIEEVYLQNQWAERSAQYSVNRQSTLLQINNFDQDGVIVVHGPEGCGKTTLVSRLAQTVAPKRLVFRSANLTQMSSTLESMLLSVVLHCGALSRQNRQPYISHRISSYGDELLKALELASGDEQLLVILDGIEQIREYSSKSLEWLPRKLPKSVKLVVTVSEASPLLRDLQSTLKESQALFIKMTDLNQKEGESILLSSVIEYNHSVNSHIQDCVLASVKQSTLPLYIKVLAWQTSWCSEFEHSLEPKGNLQEQLSNMLSDLEAILGAKLVEMCLSLLTAAKWGLTDSEMVDLLTSNREFHTSTTYLSWAGACLFWSVLNKELSPFLRWTHCATLTWRDSSLSRAVVERYSSGMPKAHGILMDYFSGTLWDRNDKIRARALSQVNRVGKRFNRRRLEELPYQTFKVKGTCKELLSNHEWVYDKLCGSSVYQVLEDFSLERHLDSDLQWLKQRLEDSSTELSYDGKQFYTQLSAGGRVVPERYSKLARDPPACSLVQLPNVCRNPEKFDMVIRLPKNRNYVVTVKTEAEELSVWDIQKCERVRTLKGVPQPISLQMIDDFRCVVLCKRELRTYDLNNGTLLTKLKGVMNQKMPYFGLHDPEHLVALSRNRMYVNLMNLTTGDLVTTFKAGEDRFLNSLLVSGDGRMLVCGDETQKPFPLLVWNLASRKLLYDLRIPGHDFVTSLSAITHQGHYVSCVAKELDEPSPNFIVVYDLQSGTLFKKWKPGIDCVAVDISSKDSCVLSGHVDSSILVWDLVTGNCRWKMTGHTFGVSHLRLDSEASACISLDLTGTDSSVRLWDLSKGSLVAVYTPRTEEPVSASELTNYGATVVLATSNGLECLQLKGPLPFAPEPLTETSENSATEYGNPDNRSKTFEVQER